MKQLPITVHPKSPAKKTNGNVTMGAVSTLCGNVTLIMIGKSSLSLINYHVFKCIISVINSRYRVFHWQFSGDGSDEGKFCSNHYATCTPNEFTCHNFKCIRSNFRCDGEDDW